jgi:heme A synthase
LIVAVHVILILRRVTRLDPRRPRLSRPAVFLTILLAIQILLGVGSFFAKFTPLLRLPIKAVVPLTTTHLAIGALMLTTALLLTLRSYRLSGTPAPLPKHNILSEQFSS